MSMKIPKSLRDIYASQADLYGRLKKRVDNIMDMHKDSGWLYISRLKGLESFALKVETGRTNNPSRPDDYFACTLVVEDLKSMAKAEKLVRKWFKLHKRLPSDDKSTSKHSDSFRFDDTRLYVRWKDDPISLTTGLDGLLFEVQLKTLLAHAWSVATHDLIYKTDEKSWPKERVAFQIKAMLEHAEISIQQAKNLARSTSLKKTDPISDQISKIINMVDDLWPPFALPVNTKRLAENIYNLIKSIGINIDRLREILVGETASGRGVNTLNLSPYSTVVQSLLNIETSKMVGYLTGKSQKFKVYIPRELEIPPTLILSHLTNAVVDNYS